MLFNRDTQIWDDIVNRTYDIEFDFIAIDMQEQIAVFSTFNRAYRPHCVTKSYNQFLSLDKFLDILPKTTIALAVRQDKNLSSYNDWKSYAELGFFAYDNQDAHRKEENKRYQYDIIFRPERPLHLEHVVGLKAYLNIIPKFDLVFGNNIKFDELQASLLD